MSYQTDFLQKLEKLTIIDASQWENTIKTKEGYTLELKLSIDNYVWTKFISMVELNVVEDSSGRRISGCSSDDAESTFEICDWFRRKVVEGEGEAWKSNKDDKYDSLNKFNEIIGA